MLKNTATTSALEHNTAAAQFQRFSQACCILTYAIAICTGGLACFNGDITAASGNHTSCQVLQSFCVKQSLAYKLMPNMPGYGLLCGT